MIISALFVGLIIVLVLVLLRKYFVERFNECKVNQNKTVSNPLLIISEE